MFRQLCRPDLIKHHDDLCTTNRGSVSLVARLDGFQADYLALAAANQALIKFLAKTLRRQKQNQQVLFGVKVGERGNAIYDL